MVKFFIQVQCDYNDDPQRNNGKIVKSILQQRKCRHFGPYKQQTLDIEPPDNDDSQIKDNISPKTEQENTEAK